VLAAAHHGLLRAFIVSSENRAGELQARQLLRRINVDAGNGAGAAEIIVMEDETDSTEQAAGFLAPIVVEASSAGLPRVNISIPLTTDVQELPLAVASKLAAT
jgi:hypothetical protein